MSAASPSRIGRTRFGWNGYGLTKGLIKEWRPRKCKTEREYEDKLEKYLRARFSGVEVERQFGVGRSRVDICVGRKVFIELKKDLARTDQAQRLIGQIALYEQSNIEKLIIVLAGSVNQELLRSVQEVAKSYESGMFDFRECTVLTVPAKRPVYRPLTPEEQQAIAESMQSLTKTIQSCVEIMEAHHQAPRRDDGRAN